ncbi:hypothetical protein [Parabacteroides goldsteinii]|uniref:hypothetical protein n=1 Tax=Parabacteroides goldsteinii TaxID=328812 RepID=UPI00321B6B39
MRVYRKIVFAKNYYLKRGVLWLILLLSIPVFTNGQIYFYKQEKVIDINTKEVKKGDLTGQFVTFNNKGCYDSDRGGNSEDNGFLSYLFENEKYVTYQGETYWGEAKYRVSLDKSRINVVLSNKILVYIKTQFPTGQQTCSLIKQQNENGVNIAVMPGGIIPDDNINNNVVNSSKYISRYKELEQQLISAFKTYEKSLCGSYDSSRSQAAHAIYGMQKNMADWRRTARQAGVNIPVSSWEVAQPSIGTIHYEKDKSY